MYINFETVLDDLKISFDNEVSFLHKQRVKNILKKILPANLFFEKTNDPNILKKRTTYLNENLPFVYWPEVKSAPCGFSIKVLTRYRYNSLSFFYDIVNRWLLPTKSLNADLFFSADFYLSSGKENRFTVMEILVHLNSDKELCEVKKNIKTLDTEIRLGVSSDFHAKRILEFKGLSNDRKTALIQEKIGSLIQSRSKDFGKGIFTQMQHFLVTCPENFRIARDYHHISRIISNLHQIRKQLIDKVKLLPSKRHLFLKFMKTKLHAGDDEKNVLGVLVGMNYLQKTEVFEKHHLIKAIQNYIPEITMVKDSFFEDNQNKGEIQTVYLEIEKK